ncbi:type II toxin-antitoxin system VapC family toxin [Ammoniphilus sp. CFH 90114]|uniref:type II toxin-antitoxin system VapC family toxin n=1 Tax=Ammoniphilus sp. CFH 90114 TaxID=2493665 RepID=UPI00100DA56B|nr:hypothetical protein [Ammoniphilus sp. CFH 90114]RXT06583.1 hypothetical protein EIZ39_16110 [Ammoniphilus sp. CFH 90114]
MIEQIPYQEKSVFIDRSAFKAFMDPKHPLCRKAASFFYGLDDLQQPLVTLNLVIYELHEWVRDQEGLDQAQFFLNAMKRAEQLGVLSIITVDESVEQEASRLMLEQQDYGLSFVEACTLVVIHDLGINRLFSLESRWSRVSRDWPDLQIVPT